MGQPRRGGSGAGGWRPVLELIGRDGDTAAIEHELTGRLVTVVGAGGVGKSMLARHVLERARADGRMAGLWIDLGWVTSEDEMAIAWSRALGAICADDESLIAAIDRRGPVLLAIDNCEHVLHIVGPTPRSTSRSAYSTHRCACGTTMSTAQAGI